MGVPLADAERALRQIISRIRVVPLRLGDYLNPTIAGIRRSDPELPRAARGDPDDLGTAAVTAFLAPTVIISKDSVFSRFGLALPADRWTEEAARLLVAAGYDAALEDAAHAAEVGAQLLFGLIGAAKNAAVRNPKAADVVAGGHDGAALSYGQWLAVDVADLVGGAGIRPKARADDIIRAAQGRRKERRKPSTSWCSAPQAFT